MAEKFFPLLHGYQRFSLKTIVLHIFKMYVPVSFQYSESPGARLRKISLVNEERNP